MSWLRSALSKAQEVTGVGTAGAGGKPSVLSSGFRGNFQQGSYFAGRVKQYAGVVVQKAGDAMAGGAKLVMERTGTAKNLNNLKHAVRRLDEVSRSASGKERTEALTRWVGALRELGKGGRLPGLVPTDSSDAQTHGEREGADNVHGHPSEHGSLISEAEGGSEGPASGPSEGSRQEEGAQLLDSSPRKDTLATASPSTTAPAHIASSVLFYDVESGDEPFTFRDVFLRSNALENIVVSLVKEPPSDHDSQLLPELLDLCMMGSSEMHAMFLKAVVDLSEVYTSYSEVKLSQDELLHMVATAVSGMKFNSEAERLEVLSTKLKRQLDGLDLSSPTSIPEAFSLSLKLADASRQLESIISHQGDDEARRTGKIETAQSLSTDLLSKIGDFENRIKECQLQLQDSVKFRSSKSEEVVSTEKVISEELNILHKRRVKLEEELEQVMGAIASATRRHIEIQEEKEQFDLVSSSIASRLTTEEEGLRVMMRQHNDDAKVLTEWKDFLKNTWNMQQTSREEGEKEAKEAGTASQERLWRVAELHLNGLKQEAVRCWDRYKAERAKLEESLSYSAGAGSETDGVPGLPADESFRIAEFRLKNALREVEKAKAEIAVRTGGMAQPGDGPARVHYDAIQAVIVELDELRKEYSSLPRLRSPSEGFSAPSD